MREWDARELEKKIRERTPEISRRLVAGRKGRVVRRRPRDKHEQDVLDILCKKRWVDAMARGKVKIISKREWYCEYD